MNDEPEPPIEAEMSPENEAFLNELVEHGRFPDLDAALDAAVGFARREHEKDIAKLRAKVQVALDASARGESRPLDIEDIKRRGMERLKARQERAAQERAEAG